ncbi:MAG: transporter substrate-binding domain-containing protein, partial [Deltaproteobacteria bacterium]|nr:transporter substrate-binding domain-containing protein [Deltaproteobacteria bacterium]
LERLSFSKSYVDETIAFIVRDHEREKFGSRESVQNLRSPTIAVPDSPYYAAKLRRYLPDANLVVVNSPRDFFGADEGTFDALLYTAESGSAWSLIYPAFTVAVPQPDILKVPLAYAVRRGDERMVELLSTWIELKHRDRTIDDLYRHWILGRVSDQSQKRWSVIANVLGWVGHEGTTPEPRQVDEAGPQAASENPRSPAPEPATPEEPGQGEGEGEGGGEGEKDADEST